MDRMRNVNKPVDSVPYGKTVIPKNRLEFLVQKCKETLGRTPGNVLEVGVYRGGTIIELARAVKEICPQYKVFGIDTFTGHPYDDGHPVHPKGKYSDVKMADLGKTFKDAGVVRQIVLIEGKVEEVLSTLDLEDISFAHIDCDLYIPVKFCAKEVPKLMNKGGIIYFDDYGHGHCPGATKAVLEVFPKEKIYNVALSDGTSWSGYINL